MAAKEAQDPSIFSKFESESPMATELRRLYHNARNAFEEKKPKTFLITSSNRGEGKSTITANLAMTIAQFPKKKVLVVDADLRRPRMHHVFDLPGHNGLTECLADDVDPLETIQQTKLPNLHILAAGTRSRTPGQLFEAEALTDVLGKAAFYYDTVLVDSAPVLAVSDTQFLCPLIDCVMLVILAGVTPREIVERARNVLIDSHARIGGVVLNNASEVLPYYYDYKYYGSAGD